MNKIEINDRITVINTRLNELVATCENEQRELNEAETAEKNALIAERNDLKAKIEQINNNQNFKSMSKEKQNFSLIRSIREIVEGKRLEGEYFDEMRERVNRSGLDYTGQIQLRALDGILTAGNNYASNSHNGGKETVAEDVLPMIDVLYNLQVLTAQNGVNFLTGLTGNSKIPVLGNITFGFKSENAAADKVTPTMAKVELTPQRLTGVIEISKLLLLQESASLEANLINNINKAISQALEMAVLGYGTSPHNGIMYNATAVAQANLTYGTVLGLVKDLQAANFAPHFIVDPLSASVLKQKAKIANTGLGAVMENGMIDGYAAHITNNIVASATATDCCLAAADLTQLNIGTWGDMLDITVDTTSLADYGKIRLVLNYYCDWAWNTTNAFSVRKVTTA